MKNYLTQWGLLLLLLVGSVAAVFGGMQENTELKNKILRACGFPNECEKAKAPGCRGFCFFECLVNITAP